MFKVRFIKFLFLCSAVALLVNHAKALPDYLKIYEADPFTKPELRGKCSVCHVNPAGGGPRNEFGRAFAQAGHKITPELRQQFPDRFTGVRQDAPPVTFTSDNEAVVEINGKRYAINTRDKTVKELAAEPKAVMAEAKPTPTPSPDDHPNIHRPHDVRLINLPTAVDIPKGSLWTDFTHRFPFGEPNQGEQLLGLDTIAYPSFGVIYGVTDWLQVGAYRSPSALGRPIQVHAGVSVLKESKGHPFNFQARVGLEGRDNFQRNFTTSFEFTFARSITRHAQVYLVPTVSVGDRPLLDASTNAPGETAVALGVGAAIRIFPSATLLAEANYRLNEEARYISPFGFTGIRRPVVGFGIMKASVSRKHSFTLTFTNGPGTTFAQRSMTRGLLGRDDGLQGLTIGFNLTRRIF
jgi:hypothetical protein